MFFYGQYKEDRYRNSKGVEMPLSEFEKIVAGRGAVYIAFSQLNPFNRSEWRFMIAGENVESLMDECQRFARDKIKIQMRRRWEMRRIDRSEFSIFECSDSKTRELKGKQLIFG